MRRLLILACFLVATPASAQLSGGGFSTPLSLTVEPDFPRPGEVVTVSVTSGSQFVDADLVWRINGEVVSEANNRRELEYVAGDLGETDRIQLNIVSDRGGSQNLVADVVPTYVDIVLEPQTRVPGFYQGRAVPSVGSQINATALVNNGTLLEGSDHVYTWEVNGNVLEGGPIRGTNKVSFDTPRGSRITLVVTVTDRSGTLVARDGFYFKSVKPQMEFYETNALYGQSPIAVGRDLVLADSAATITAEPYYLDIRTFNNPDIVEWEINNDAQPPAGGNPYQITIQKVDAGGTARVSFHVRSTTELLQGVEERINVIY